MLVDIFLSTLPHQGLFNEVPPAQALQSVCVHACGNRGFPSVAIIGRCNLVASLGEISFEKNSFFKKRAHTKVWKSLD